MRHLREFDGEKIKTPQVRKLDLSLQIRWLNGIILHNLLYLLRADDNNSILLQVEHIREIDLLLNCLLLSRLCLGLLIESLQLASLIDVPEDEAEDVHVESLNQLLLLKSVSEIHENKSPAA